MADRFADVNLEAMLERYRLGTEVFLVEASSLSDKQLDRRPDDEGWTAREIIHHMADAELRSTVRLRQLLAEESPVIQGYDEEGYAKRLPVARSVGVSLQAIAAARAANLELLKRCSADDLSRSGTHTESGVYTLRDWLRIYADHPHEHADQVRSASEGST